jgi:hypothetical protein
MEKHFYKKEVHIPLYRGTLLIFLTNDSSELQKHIPDFKDEEPYGHTLAVNYNGRAAYAVIFNFLYSYRKITHGTITHESIHAANFIASDRGIVADFNNDEPIAYLADWITDEIYKFIEESDFDVKNQMQ